MLTCLCLQRYTLDSGTWSFGIDLVKYPFASDISEPLSETGGDKVSDLEMFRRLLFSHTRHRVGERVGFSGSVPFRPRLEMLLT